MNLQEITTVEQLLAAVDEYLKTPRLPPIKGSELNTIITKAIKIILEQISLASKTTIPALGDFVINWQTDIVPDGTKTFAEKHGNKSFISQGFFQEGLKEASYSPSVFITKQAGKITSVEIKNVFPGLITII